MTWTLFPAAPIHRCYSGLGNAKGPPPPNPRLSRLILGNLGASNSPYRALCATGARAHKARSVARTKMASSPALKGPRLSQKSEYATYAEHSLLPALAYQVACAPPAPSMGPGRGHLSRTATPGMHDVGCLRASSQPVKSEERYDVRMSRPRTPRAGQGADEPSGASTCARWRCARRSCARTPPRSTATAGVGEFPAAPSASVDEGAQTAGAPSSAVAGGVAMDVDDGGADDKVASTHSKDPRRLVRSTSWTRGF